MLGLSGAEFNWVDYTFIAVFVLSTLAGFVRGLFREVLALIVLAAAFVVATMFANSLAAYFGSASTMQQVASVEQVSYAALAISYGVLFAGTMLAGAIISFFVSLIFQATVLGIGNRLLGGLFGFMRGFAFNLVIVFIIQLTSYGKSPAWQQSQLVEKFKPAAAWLSGLVSPSLEDLKKKFISG